MVKKKVIKKIYVYGNDAIVDQSSSDNRRSPKTNKNTPQIKRNILKTIYTSIFIIVGLSTIIQFSVWAYRELHNGKEALINKDSLEKAPIALPNTKSRVRKKSTLSKIDTPSSPVLAEKDVKIPELESVVAKPSSMEDFFKKYQSPTSSALWPSNTGTDASIKNYLNTPPSEMSSIKLGPGTSSLGLPLSYASGTLPLALSQNNTGSGLLQLDFSYHLSEFDKMNLRNVFASHSYETITIVIIPKQDSPRWNASQDNYAIEISDFIKTLGVEGTIIRGTMPPLYTVLGIGTKFYTWSWGDKSRNINIDVYPPTLTSGIGLSN